MAVTAKILKLWFSLFFLVSLPPRSSVVKVNQETKEFIGLVIEIATDKSSAFQVGLFVQFLATLLYGRAL